MQGPKQSDDQVGTSHYYKLFSILVFVVFLQISEVAVTVLVSTGPYKTLRSVRTQRASLHCYREVLATTVTKTQVIFRHVLLVAASLARLDPEFSELPRSYTILSVSVSTTVCPHILTVSNLRHGC